MKLNWFKKLFSTNEEENNEVVEMVEEPAVPKNTQTPFRFPLIPDEEKKDLFYGETKPEKMEQPINVTPIVDDKPYRPLYTHELWQQRKQQPVVQKPVGVQRTPKKETVEKPVEEKRKKAFTPSQVPSPVFGFSREQKKREEARVNQGKLEPKLSLTQVPSPVYGFTKKQVQEEKEMETNEQVPTPSVQSVVVEAEKTLVSEEVVIEETTITEISNEVITVTPQKEESTVASIEENVVIREETKQQEVMQIEPFERIAPSTIEAEVAIEEIAVTEVLEEALTDTLEQTETLVPLEEKEEPKAAPNEKIRPFNVLMLKSDKEKMNKLQNAMNFNKSATKTVIEQPLEQQTPLVKPEIKEEPVESATNTIQEVPITNYERPDLSYLLPPEMKNEDREWMEEQAFTLIEALSHFQVTGEIVQMVQGPAVTQFEITVGHGTKVSKIRNLADDLKLALAAKDIRIQAPIPGKSSIGIEIPNRTSRAVRLSEVINTEVFLESESPLEAALGLDLTGKPVTLDLRKMPHGLIAGATGSGKSVFINSLLVSLLYKATPDEVKLLLIDPKMVELAPFNHIPHLVSPVITDVKAATAALKWAVEEMERRYQLFAHIGVRDISRYNNLATEKRQFAQKLPYIVIVIDELADLMMMAPTEVEDAICRIAQKARACGIHLVLATQRPSVDVITGLIKANIPTRIAFSVSSQIDSRTILDQQGAERLLGKGDMLYQGNGMSSPVRIQGTFVTDDEIEQVIEYARTQGTPDYIFEQEELLQKADTNIEQDELFEEACRFIVEQGSASTSLLQRKFHLGYNRAARLIDAMYENGYVTEQKGSKAREVLLTDDSLDQIFS